MFAYQKMLQFPVDIKKRDLRFAKVLLTQYGGANSELAASTRYLTQSYNMPDEKGKSLLHDIAVEEMSHLEIVACMLYQLMKGATPEEMKAAGLDGWYADHGKDLYYTNPDGVPYTVTYTAAVGDALANLSEDMAAEEKARTMYENLIDLATDRDVIEPLEFLRQREIIHFTRFKELYDEYKRKGIK